MSACLASSVVSVQLWVEEARRLRSLLPRHIAAALERCELAYPSPQAPEPGAAPAPALTDAQIDRQARSMRALFPIISHPLVAYIAALASYIPALRPAVYDLLGIQFVLRHVCRLRPMPPGVFRMLAGSNGEIYATLWGPGEFFVTGPLQEWDFRPHLEQIRVPVLVLSGRYDEATPMQMAILKAGIVGSEQVILEQSAHCGMWEEPEAFRSALLSFITRVEQAGVA